MKDKSLASLHEKMRRCRRCLEEGYLITPGAVFSGNATAQVMVIGQAPGVTEVEAKRPFNAGSGRRLFQWLGDAGWEEKSFRQRHYMTAVTKCYPGRGPSGRGDRVPSKTEQALCRSFLELEIDLLNPRLIILVGSLAIKLLYPPSKRLNEIIGTAAFFPQETLADPVKFDLARAERLPEYHAGKNGDGRWVVPLPHPSGASLWPNKPENQELIQQAIRVLHDIRVNLDL